MELKTKCFCGKEASLVSLYDTRLFCDDNISKVLLCEDHCNDLLLTNILPSDINNDKDLIPSHLDKDLIYDYYGNQINKNGTRVKGELFFEEDVQSILKDKMDVFLKYIRYPRTYHFPFSNVSNDDKILKDLSYFDNKRVVITEKLDGENTSIYNDYIHSRSPDGRSHWTRDWLKQYASEFQHDIPDNWKVCGENVFATHSIRYDNLESYFYCFSVFDDKNICLSWDDTLEWCNLLNLQTPQLLFDDIFDLEQIKDLTKFDTKNKEGFVMRIADSIPLSQFSKSIAKYVRPNHVSTDSHWMHGEILQNKLKVNKS